MLLAGAALAMAALGVAAYAAGVAPRTPRRPALAGELTGRGPLTQDETKDECAKCSDAYSKGSGVIANPKMLGGAMTFEDVQKALHADCPTHCHKKRRRRPGKDAPEDAPEQSDEDYLKELANSTFNCSTTRKGDLCYDLVEWTVRKVGENPDFYRGVSRTSSLEQVQLRLHRDRPGICPVPCLEGLRRKEGRADSVGDPQPQEEECHTAERGEDCFSSVVWVLKEGILAHPKWFLGLNSASTFEEVQEHLHKDHGSNGVKCPKPCEEGVCRDAVKGEPCFESVKWAMDEGIANHSDWFQGVTVDSSFAEVQMNFYLNPNATVACPRPCSYCHTAVPGERCHSAVVWVMEEGLSKQPESYRGLHQYSSFQEVQHHLWNNKSEQDAHCQKPCAVASAQVDEISLMAVLNK